VPSSDPTIANLTSPSPDVNSILSESLSQEALFPYESLITAPGGSSGLSVSVSVDAVDAPTGSPISSIFQILA